jgi:hypothetical protein
MIWYHCVSYFFGGVFLANAVPHLTSGLTGAPFQTPFATPRGVGLSSSSVNVWWGAFNVVAGYWLLCQVGLFELRNVGHVAVTGLGAMAISSRLARHFGRFHGGNDPG